MSSFLKKSGQALTEIRNDLICQVCENRARPGKKRWYRCMVLHQICQDCRIENKINKCSCDQPISFDYDKTMEKLLSVAGMKYNCINTKNGCKEVLAETALEAHESECIYRSVPCLTRLTLALGVTRCDCEEKVTFKDVIQDYEDHEKVTLEEHDLKIKHLISWDDDVYLSGENAYNDPTKFTLNNQTFLLAGKTQDDVVYRWVYILGSPNDAKHFGYTLKLYGPKSTLTFDGKVAAIDESFPVIYRTGKCFANPHQMFLNQVLDDDDEYEYSLEIRNLKEEAMDENYESGISDNE